ncbi:MAG: hypothetical protein A2900_04780 [Candidatus Chisholmbacteria bacterium RIFCSPLOWO2_01_FULL_50_28]|uniref:S-adenosylmethionine decarboxylase proenzyme n=1 Tax=Candidatus Chisholmbacteria bacterium RIFCSPHIGHO2_01_FULL_52_32 TaxID=1797591 RepID=A0A1G1VS72_9BACT|nr:MAG: hypothetical protein A2786_01965 [Candidatus Chisholmbacteria bacterium RIFCSPHIGHO2_01_FULL_52_32]OGY20362.1 MAG: hypothetical protein A2900_04780 [Candidatus Chisholmbacteria bacterium RIFCSPLOWO2_01_FULL_50_28]
MTEQSTRVKGIRGDPQAPNVYQFSALAVVRDAIPDTEERVGEFAHGIIKGLHLTALQKSSFRFHPSGMTIVFILSQSHLAIHTWPEYRSVHIDLVSCVPLRKAEVLACFREVFRRFGIERFIFKTERMTTGI